MVKFNELQQRHFDFLDTQLGVLIDKLEKDIDFYLITQNWDKLNKECVLVPNIISANTAFKNLIKKYEDNGWKVRTCKHKDDSNYCWLVFSEKKLQEVEVEETEENVTQ
jgi:hypothetical protein